MARMSREKSAFAGLSSAEAEKRLAKYGENILSNKKAVHPARIFAGQFKDFMVMILLGATVISVLMGEAVEALTIFNFNKSKIAGVLFNIDQIVSRNLKMSVSARQER